MQNVPDFLLNKLLQELDLPSYPLGSELEKAIYSSGGIPFIRRLFAIPGMSDKIFDMTVEIKKCNLDSRGDLNHSCVKDLQKKREDIKEEIERNGLVFIWDVMDNFWDKLPGD